MGWTTPRDWATDELVTEAMMDTHVKDQLVYLYDNRQRTVNLYSASDGTTQSTLSTGYTATGFSLGGVVLAVASDIFVMCTFTHGHDDPVSYGAGFQIYRGGVAKGLASYPVKSGEGGANRRYFGAMNVVETAVAAGTYTYEIYFKTDKNTKYTYFADAYMSAIVVPNQETT